MARQAKPWFRRQTGWWMVCIGGKQIKLAEGWENRDLALKKFHELMLVAAEAPDSRNARVFSVCDEFLVWSHRNQSAETYRGYEFYVQGFCDACGYVKVAELRPYHVTRWLDANDWNPTTRYNAQRSVFRVFNWAASEGLLDRNPLKGMKRSQPLSRQRCLTDDEWRLLFGNARGSFKVFLYALQQTGARPSEVRGLTWDQVHQDRWVLRVHKTSGKTVSFR
jgi:integrase